VRGALAPVLSSVPRPVFFAEELRTTLLQRTGMKVEAMEQDISTAARPIRIPGSDHPITIERNPNRVKVSVAGQVVAETANALTLREAAYLPVQYIPREDVDMSLLERTDHTTYCPYKGQLQLLQRRDRGRTVGERRLELRDALPRGVLDQRASRFLSGSRRGD
jgi:RNase P/RNase MRP subunit p29